jgi:hypothetical protein
MGQTMFLVAYFCIAIGFSSYATEIDYTKYKSIQDVIARETQEIHNISSADHEELAQLFVSRGESYLLNAQYENAIEDFHNAKSHLGYSHNVDTAMVIAFRAALGETVSYDNLGMTESTQEAIQQLQTIASYIGCANCMQDRPCQGMTMASSNILHFSNIIRPARKQNQDNYSDIIGPNEPPYSDWCEETVTGVGRAMDAIACLAPNYVVKVALIGVIEALMTRGIKCCQAGGFWKACVAPIARKWKEWKDKKENNIYPNSNNLPTFLAFSLAELRSSHEQYVL